jgi:NTP pyrophosphatase (non-canonical NTP hydrolase)
MTFEDYSCLASTTAQYSGNQRERLTYVSIALGGEVGEYLNEYKKFLRAITVEGKIPSGEIHHKMLLELGDTLWYLNRAALELNSSLAEVAEMNIMKLSKRYSENS